jgi:hypothetical protein
MKRVAWEAMRRRTLLSPVTALARSTGSQWQEKPTSELRSYVESVLALASPAGDRDSGTRLIMVEKAIADCLRPVGPDPKKQLERLETFDTEVRNALQRHPNAAGFLVEVAELIATQKRHL